MCMTSISPDKNWAWPKQYLGGACSYVVDEERDFFRMYETKLKKMTSRVCLGGIAIVCYGNSIFVDSWSEIGVVFYLLCSTLQAITD